MYKKVYFVKLCPNFVGSPSFHFKIYQRILWNTSLLGKSPSIGFCIPERETPQPVLPYCTMSQKCHYKCYDLHTLNNSFTCDYCLFAFLIKAYIVYLRNKHTLLIYEQLYEKFLKKPVKKSSIPSQGLLFIKRYML